MQILCFSTALKRKNTKFRKAQNRDKGYLEMGNMKSHHSSHPPRPWTKKLVMYFLVTGLAEQHSPSKAGLNKASREFQAPC